MVDDYRLAGDFEERWEKGKCRESAWTFDKFHGRRQQRKKQLITEVWLYPEMVLLWKAGLALPGDRFQHTPTRIHIHMHTYIQKHTHAHTCVQYTHLHTTHMHTHIHIQTHTHLHTHSIQFLVKGMLTFLSN